MTLSPATIYSRWSPLVSAILVFLLAIAGATVLIWRLEQDRIEDKRLHVSEHLASNYAYDIQRHIERVLSVTYALAALVRQGKGPIAHFDAVANEMLPFYPGASALALAPGGVVQQIIPLVGNEKAVGHDLLKDPARTKEAFLARDTGKLTLAGPFNLIQGGLAAAGRLPVFLDDEQGRPAFWGFTIVLIRFPEALDSAHLSQLVDQGFHYELWRIHPDTGQKQVIASSSAALIDPVEHSLNLPNGTWVFSVSPVSGWRNLPGLALRMALGLAFSLLLAFLAKHLAVEREAQRALAEYQTQLEIKVTERTADLEAEIHERQQIEQALRESENRYRAILEAMPDLLFVFDRNGVYLHIHAGHPEDLLVPPEQALGRSIQETLPARLADVVIRQLQKAFATGQAQSLEYSLEIAGETRYFEGRIIAYAPDRALTIVRNITERRQAEAELLHNRDQLQLANAALARAARLKDEFLATMSHELRTPLTGIIGLAEALQLGVYGPLSAEQNATIQMITESGRHLLELIKDILDLSKIEAGKLDLQINRLNINDLCQTCLRMITPLASAKRQTVHYQAGPTHLTLQADPRRLKQILVNLLSNAVKFTPDGREIGLEITGDAEQQVVRFTVWDQGIGIAESDFSRLFQPFTQLDSGLDRAHGGAGLGLALVRRLTELHGGGVSVSSAPGAGSRFTVTLPWRPEESGVAQSLLTDHPSRLEKRGRDVTVLVAEDDEISLILIRDYLSALGYRVVAARDGGEAVALAREILPDAILMDIQMPVLDGLEAIRQLRALDPPRLAQTPMIALTALAMPGDRERCLSAGASAYFSKPLNLNELARELRDILDRAGGSTHD
jgi:PAS domain S-box-containing protein